MAATPGVFPVWENKFKLGTKGLASTTPTDLKTIAEMDTFTVAIDNGVEEWTPMDTEGWRKRLLTAKSITITLSGKRCIGDEGNDYAASLAWESGRDCEAPFEWEFPDGAKLAYSAVVSVTAVGGGDSTNVAGLEMEIMSNGKPTYTPAASA